ncbi:MAG: cyclic pyranopterin monophosphate synthase MoaC [Pyrinomonadaceae bacterium]
MTSELTHFNENEGAKMVDIAEKPLTKRTAKASCFVKLRPDVVEAVRNNSTPKGNPMEVAKIAGIMGAKKTSELIPLCHQLNLSKVGIDTELADNGVRIVGTAVTTGQTGVEMEALTAVSIAALAVYDMCKALQRDIEISDIRLEAKEGGIRGDYKRQE